MKKKYLVPCIVFVILFGKKGACGPLTNDLDKISAEEMARLALEDSMYYRFDEWFARFRKEINRLESLTPSLENRVELMKHYFNYSGLLGELTHTLAFTSKYQIKKISLKNFCFTAIVSKIWPMI